MSMIEQEIARLEKELAGESEVVVRLERLAISGKDRTIPLHKQQLVWLKSWLAELRAELVAGGAGGGHGR